MCFLYQIVTPIAMIILSTLNTLGIKLPAALSVPSIDNVTQAAFINICRKAGTQRLNLHATYIQLKYIAPTKVTANTDRQVTMSVP